jgi:hypothetical protein
MTSRQKKHRSLGRVFAMWLAGLLALQACAAGSAPTNEVTYTLLGVPQMTFAEDVTTVVQAVQKALGKLEMPVREMRRLEEGGQVVRTEVVASAPGRRITVTVARVGDKRTKVSADVREEAVILDRATARAIVQEIGLQVEGKN